MKHSVRPTKFDSQQEMRARQIEIRHCLDDVSPTVDTHCHSHYELYFFCEGGLERYVVGTKSYCLQQGDILLIPPRVMHHPVFQEGTGRYQRYVLWCSQEYLSRLKELDPDISYILQLCLTQGEYLLRFPSPSISKMLENELHTIWVESQGSALCRETAIQLSCMNFLVQLNRSVSAGTVVVSIQSPGTSLLGQVIAYIQEHYREPITLNAIAKRFFVSPSTIEHQFAQKLGWSFYRYVTRRRIIEAQNLITDGIPIKIVCQNCGYTDYSTFYKVFTKEVGMTPSQYRKIGQRYVLETLIE